MFDTKPDTTHDPAGDDHIITARARVQEQIFSITQQIKQHRLQQNATNPEWILRARAKLKYLEIEWDTLNAELRHRKKLREIAAANLRLAEKDAQFKERELKLRQLEIEQHEKTERHRINTERDSLNRRTRVELFYVVLCKYLDFTEREAVWREVDETYYNLAGMKVETFSDDVRNAVIVDYIREKSLGAADIDLCMIGNRYGVSVEVVGKIVQHLV